MLRPSTLQRRSSVTVQRPSNLTGVETHLGHFEASSLPRHMHATYQLGLILRGTGRFYYRGSYHTVGAGSLITIEPGKAHGGYSLEPWSFSFTFVEPQLVARWLGGNGFTRFGSFGVAPLLAPTLERLYQHFLTSDGSDREAHLFSLLQVLFGEHGEGPGVGSRREATPREPRAVVLIRDYLHAHFYEGVTLNGLAELTGLHPNYLHGVFKDATGLTPHGYLTSLRIAHAAEQLRVGATPAAAAAAAGYTDQSHLTKHFRRYVGVTPAHYQRSQVG